MFFRNSPEAVEVTETEKIGPREVIAYIEELGRVSAEPDRRITDQQGNRMTDHPHLRETWEATGQNEFDLNSSRVFKYEGRFDTSGRVVKRL